MTDSYDRYLELLDEVDMLKTRVDVMQGEINRRQEMIFLLRRALEPFAKYEEGDSKENNFARKTMQITAPRGVS